ncbi:heavy metal translocating P-type ATPase [Coprococcus catus]|uniref:Cd(2+)-exporting ATPase n=2 Tax=Coprococcus catus TaxID=116085 RepID=A0A3E2TNA1_9FIRM|nr:heavy metal translocating P-type ATPase [Coprococcus catus]RGB78937.1 heavy metal translocating P-type ATPase [Coprococcus catus]CBK80924.1 ATPase, P-type (transporting), HAD superfamily, subfamily IC/heavy metal translocating P-type ATPase [Coprococcus catus GD/7]
MKFVVKHEIKGRIRVHFCQKRMTFEEADTLQYYLDSQEMITSSKVQERTQDATICYTGEKSAVIALLRSFRYEKVDVPDVYRQNSGRETNREYWDKLVTKVVVHYGNKLFLPMPIRTVITGVKSVKYIYQGIHTLLQRKIEVPVLDATAIGVSMFRGDISTAGSVMFLLGIGEILEEWTHKKSVDDLARSMSLNISRVWLCNDGQEMLVPTTKIQTGDLVRVHMGNMVPFDGTVAEGEAMVNQASLTGESEPVRKYIESTVYAGTVVEEGELTIRVKETNGSSKFDKIVTMIEESEKLKSGLESKAEHLADRLVPYTLLGTGITYLLTRNITKAISVLMVDFSCALKLAMPISVLSAIREASNYHVTVKGGRYLEAMAEADTIVFDKTGTLTKAQPTVKQVVAFNGMSENELLRIAACLEEHFPHSMAKAVVQAAIDRHLVHEELHSKVEYIVAHGISSKINDKKVVIGSYHFVFEDEKCAVPDGMMEEFDKLPSECSHLFMAIDHELAAVICIEDPLREEAAAVVRKLKETGISKVVMMTGDSDRTAKAIAARVGVDEYYSEVLPEDKASFVEEEKKAGRKVIMIGDGINDSPALSAADIGIAISDGAEIAREIADITVGADSLNELVTLKLISDGLMKRIHKNYRFIVGFNTGLIVLGVAGILQPATSALLHNTSTLMIGLKSMQDIL